MRRLCPGTLVHYEQTVWLSWEKHLGRALLPALLIVPVADDGGSGAGLLLALAIIPVVGFFVIGSGGGGGGDDGAEDAPKVRTYKPPWPVMKQCPKKTCYWPITWIIMKVLTA